MVSRPPDSVEAFIALGSNLGDRAAAIRSALDSLAATPGIRVEACSRLLETAPVGGPPGQSPYLNAAARLATTLDARELLAALLDIERRLGRVRGVRNGPRVIDLDLLLLGDVRVESEALTLPHPRMWERAFVLEPLRELCGPSRVAELAARFAPVEAAEAAQC